MICMYRLIVQYMLKVFRLRTIFSTTEGFFIGFTKNLSLLMIQRKIKETTRAKMQLLIAY